MGNTTKCRSCGAEIKFIKLTNGKWNPVDVGRRTIKRGEGNDVIVTDNGEVVRGTFCGMDDGGNCGGYVSHFATCPNAGQFRKR